MRRLTASPGTLGASDREEESENRPRGHHREDPRMLATHSLNRLPAAERGITIGDFLVPIRIGERMSARLRHIALVGIGAAFIALTANVTVWLPNNPVPVTGQTLSVLLVGGALGLRRGVLSIALYLLLGFFLPVYAGHAQGAQNIVGFGPGGLVLGALGGYLLGFLVAAALVGRLAELGWDRHIPGAVGAMVVGEIVIYLVGVPWLAAAAHFSPAMAIDKGLLPFVLGDAVKLAIAAGLFPFAWWLVGRRADDR
jgi:biotin transport system substrate-specific component